MIQNIKAYFSREKHQQICDLIELINRTKSSDKINEILAEIGGVSGKEIAFNEIEAYWRWTTLEDLASTILLPSPQLFLDLSKEALIELIEQARLIQSTIYFDFYCDLLRLNTASDQNPASLIHDQDLLPLEIIKILNESKIEPIKL